MVRKHCLYYMTKFKNLSDKLKFWLENFTKKTFINKNPENPNQLLKKIRLKACSEHKTSFSQ